MKYAILDNTGICINITEWDGISPWSPPEGTIAVMVDEPRIQKKYFYDQELKQWKLLKTPTIEKNQSEGILDYGLFWDRLILSDAYKEIREHAKNNLEINLYCTEFISLLLNAKTSEPNKQQLQEVIWELFETLNQDSLINSKTIEEINELFNLYLFNQKEDSLEYTISRNV